MPSSASARAPATPSSSPFSGVVHGQETVRPEREVARRLLRLRHDEPRVPTYEVGEEGRRVRCGGGVAVRPKPPQPRRELPVEPGTEAERAVAVEHPPRRLAHHPRRGLGRGRARRQQPGVAPRAPRAELASFEQEHRSPGACERLGAADADRAAADDDDVFRNRSVTPRAARRRSPTGAPRAVISSEDQPDRLDGRLPRRPRQLRRLRSPGGRRGGRRCRPAGARARILRAVTSPGAPSPPPSARARPRGPRARPTAARTRSSAVEERRPPVRWPEPSASSSCQPARVARRRIAPSASWRQVRYA